MANHKSALKRHRQSLGRRARNSYYKTTMRTLLRRAREALAAGDGAAAGPIVAEATACLDRVANRGVIHPNRAARVKSRLTRQLQAL